MGWASETGGANRDYYYGVLRPFGFYFCLIFFEKLKTQTEGRRAVILEEGGSRKQHNYFGF